MHLLCVDIKKLDDWYHVTQHEFLGVGGNTLFLRYGSISNLLTAVYPEYQYMYIFMTFTG